MGRDIKERRKDKWTFVLFLEGKMNLKENFKNLMDKASKMTSKELNTYRNALFFLICADIFGLYWFLHMKRLGMMLLIVFLVILGIIMYLESKLPKEKTKVPTQLKKKEVKKMNENEMNEETEEEGFSFGLPNADDFNERMDKAFEFKGLGCIF
jgi:Na+-transporting methylmalonyl-CoA/oxaloacetate decarboxylase gamma subunit